MQTRTRREFLKAIGLAAASAAASSVLPGCAGLGSITKQAKDRPNIIFVMSDDHASNAISCYGGILSKVIKTDQAADKVPLADQSCLVAGLLQQFRESLLFAVK